MVIIIRINLCLRHYEQLFLTFSFGSASVTLLIWTLFFNGPVFDLWCLCLHPTQVPPDRLVSMEIHSQSVCICTKFCP